MTKKRIDILLVEKGLAESRTKAQAYLLSGQVIVFGKRVDKAGTLIDEGSEVEVKERFPYVSRGALKLQKAYEEFGFDFKDKVICDIGSSTGGFTDFALARGAKKVYAIDVGYGQLDQKLRNNPAVINMERTNIRDVKSLPEPIDIFTIDVSFISLKQVLQIVKQLIKKRMTNDKRQKTCDIVALIKPQFEVGKKIADKYKGVIKDEKIQSGVVDDISKFAKELGFGAKGIPESPILGAKGNKEFLIWLCYNCKAND